MQLFFYEATNNINQYFYEHFRFEQNVLNTELNACTYTTYISTIYDNKIVVNLVLKFFYVIINVL